MGAWSQIQQIVSNFTLFQLTLDTQVTLGVFSYGSLYLLRTLKGGKHLRQISLYGRNEPHLNTPYNIASGSEANITQRVLKDVANSEFSGARLRPRTGHFTTYTVLSFATPGLSGF